MIVIPASLRSDFIHMAGMTIHIALESTIHIVGIRTSLLRKMPLLRWSNPGHDTRRASSLVRGAGSRELNSRLRRREKNVLDIPFYRPGHYTQNRLPGVKKPTETVPKCFDGVIRPEPRPRVRRGS